MTQKVSFKKRLTEIRQADEQFLYFVTFLFALSTGEVGSVDLIKTGESAGYGKYSRSFQDIFRLGVGWGYGLAKSTEMIAAKINSGTDPLKQLLVKMAQVIRLGDELRGFFTDELSAALHNYSTRYERNLESQKLFLEIFYTISSTASFMIASNAIMAMLMGQANAERTFLGSLVGVVASMSSFIFILYMIFPRDTLAAGINDMSKKFKMSLFASISIGASLGIILTILSILPLSLVAGISVAPLFIPGLIARKMESRIRGLNEWYPSFVRHFGQIYVTIGSVGQALEAVLRSDFGPLTKHITAFKNRIRNRIDPEIAFDLFSKECGSTIIESGNMIVSKSLVKGSDLNEVGNKVSDISAKINELRAKRLQTSKTFETIVIVLHGMTLAIFGLMSKLTEIFHTLISSVPVSNSAITLTSIDPAFMTMMTPIFILSTSAINGMAIKVAQGGLYKTVFFNIAMLCVIGSVALYGVDAFLSKFLTHHILDIYQNYQNP